MALILTEEQELLQETAREFVQEHFAVDELRTLRDARDPRGHSAELWRSMAELGWCGILFPEDCGGSELGYAELGIVLEELGRSLAVTPFLGTVLLGGSAVWLGGSDAQRKDLLPGVCAGETLLALAYQETPRHDPFRIRTRAAASGDGYTLSGRKTLVFDGHVADMLVVAARTSGDERDRAGISLFLVDPGAQGMERTRTFLVDSRSAAELELRDVQVTASALLGRVDHGGELLAQVLDRATVGLAAEMLGGIQEAFERTVEYLKNREQFGAKIGSFQALKHRAAEWFCEVELSKSVVLEALRAIDEDRPDVAELASACKARVSDVFVHSGEEGVQLHGGIGMTDEEDIGFFLKRARVHELTLGDSAFHRDRFAELRGY